MKTRATAKIVWMPYVMSVQVGPVREHGTPGSDDPMQKPWMSGFFKFPVDGPVRVWAEGVIGDAQADLKNHGGPDKAVLGYAWSNTLAWRTEEPLIDFPPGAFGENLTIDGQAEPDVCIGDVYRVGSRGVILEVSQPRQPCWKLGRRFGRKDLPVAVIENGRTGWYFRVREVGEVQAGDQLELIERPYAGLTIERMNDVIYGRRPLTEVESTCPALSASWRKQLGAMLGRQD